MSNRPAFALVTIALLLGATACNKQKNQPLEVPETYSFSNVSYSGQIDRLDQLEDMIAYVESANDGAQLDVAVLNDMFSNTGGNGNGSFTFTSEKGIASKTFEPHLDQYATYFEKVVAASTSGDTASNGVAGISYSSDGSSKRLYDENGYEYSEFIEKGLMGALCYYQATFVYLSDDKMDVDNEEVTEGKGTAMEHHWDEAYGYFGASNDFPNDIENVRFWAKYCVGRDALLGSIDALSLALRHGRMAISANRLDERDSAIAEVRKEWENVAAATALHYINEALDNMGDDHVRNHVLSEAVPFVQSLFYNPERRITEAKIDEVINLLGDNFYEVSSSDLQSARDILSSVYGWDNIKSAL